MESPVVTLFFDKCRLCLENRGVRNIFKPQNLQSDIAACTGVKVYPTDNFPAKICSKCLETVLNAKELRQLATKNDKHLKSLFSKNCDDDSDDTLCLEELSNNEEKYASPSKPSKDCDTSGSDSDQDDSRKKPKLAVRKDLFNTPLHESDVKIVTSKEEYDKIKKQMKFDPKLIVIFKCPLQECKKRKFVTYKKLYLHLRLHNKNIVCPICSKKFATKGDMEKHLRTHTGVRPYFCTICDKRFTQHAVLKAHTENVHNCYIVP